jgi:hypothetical protein
MASVLHSAIYHSMLTTTAFDESIMLPLLKLLVSASVCLRVAAWVLCVCGSTNSPRVFGAVLTLFETLDRPLNRYSLVRM